MARRRGLPPTDPELHTRTRGRGRRLHPRAAGGPSLPRRLDVVCLFETGAELARATEILDAVDRAARRARSPAYERRSPRGHARLLGLREGGGRARGLARALRRAASDRRLGRTDRRRAHRLPRPRRRARPRRRPDGARDPGPTPGIRRRPLQGDGTGRGGVRSVWRSRRRVAPPRTARSRRRGGAVGRRPGPRRRLPRGDRPDASGERSSVARAGHNRGLRTLVHRGHADPPDRVHADRVAPRLADVHDRGARRAAGDPMGVLLGAGSREPSRVVRTRRRARGGR